MTIETKYNRWDMVWYLDASKVRRNQITSIYVSAYEDGEIMWIRYKVDGTVYSEEELFATKKELIASL